VRNCRVADAVLRNLSPAVEFPANRENNREPSYFRLDVTNFESQKIGNINSLPA